MGADDVYTPTLKWFHIMNAFMKETKEKRSTQSNMGMSDEMKELAQMLHDTCVAETGVSEDLIAKVNSEKVFADDENLKCYIKCLMAQMACIDDDGIIDEEATIAVLPEEMQDKAAPVIRACGTKKGANPCENAWLSHKCYAEMEPDAYMLI